MLGFVQQGKGPPLVLIHGVGLRAEAWEAITAQLAPHFEVFGVDMPGHGASFLSDVQDLEDYVARFAVFLRRFDGPIYLAGHSMGAIIALKLAHQNPGQIGGVAALNAIFRRSAEAAEAVRARAAAIAGGGPIDNAPTLARWFGTRPKGAMKEAAKACGTWLRHVDRTGYARAYAAFAAQDGPSEAELGMLACPALFMTGEGDLNSTPEMSQAMARLAPQGRAVILQDAAHMMPMTHAEQVSAALLETFRPERKVA